MLTILVGDVFPDTKEHYCDAQRMLPSELVTDFMHWGVVHKWTGVVRIYNATLLNWLGIQIEHKAINHEDIEILTLHGRHLYNEQGMVSEGWPYGVFSF